MKGNCSIFFFCSVIFCLYARFAGSVPAFFHFLSLGMIATAVLFQLPSLGMIAMAVFFQFPFLGVIEFAVFFQFPFPFPVPFQFPSQFLSQFPATHFPSKNIGNPRRELGRELEGNWERERNWKNTAFSVTPRKGNWKNTAFSISLGKGNRKKTTFSITPKKGNWKSTACGRTFATRPAEVGFIIHYYGGIM